MTHETMQAVVIELNGRGIPATLEYPGYIEIVYVGASGDQMHLMCGDTNETFCCDICEADYNAIDGIESTIPSDSTDVQAVAEFIASTHSQAVRFDGIERASQAFWAVIAETYPEIKTGDFPPDADRAWQQACRKAVIAWYAANHVSNKETGK